MWDILHGRCVAASLQWALTLVAGKWWEKRRGTGERSGEKLDCFEWNSREGSVSYTTHAHSAYPCTACAVERAQGCRSIWEHPTMHTYDPWGLGSGQSECMTQIARAAGGEYHTETNIRWKPVKTTRKKMFWSFKKIWKKMRDVKRMMFYCHTKFQVETHYEMWAMKKINSALIVTLLFSTIQC